MAQIVRVPRLWKASCETCQTSSRSVFDRGHERRSFIGLAQDVKAGSPCNMIGKTCDLMLSRVLQGQSFCRTELAETKSLMK